MYPAKPKKNKICLAAKAKVYVYAMQCYATQEARSSKDSVVNEKDRSQ